MSRLYRARLRIQTSVAEELRITVTLNAVTLKSQLSASPFNQNQQRPLRYLRHYREPFVVPSRYLISELPLYDWLFPPSRLCLSRLSRSAVRNQSAACLRSSTPRGETERTERTREREREREGEIASRKGGEICTYLQLNVHLRSTGCISSVASVSAHRSADAHYVIALSAITR